MLSLRRTYGVSLSYLWSIGHCGTKSVMRRFFPWISVYVVGLEIGLLIRQWIYLLWSVQALSYFSWVTWIWPDNAGECLRLSPIIHRGAQFGFEVIAQLFGYVGFSCPFSVLFVDKMNGGKLHAWDGKCDFDRAIVEIRITAQGMSILTFDWSQIACVSLSVLSLARVDEI